MAIDTSMTGQLLELVAFLHDKSSQVRQIALHNLLGYTAKSDPNRHIFLTSDHRPIKDLKLLCRDQPMIAHDAFKALTNLAQDNEILKDLDDADYIDFLIKTITSPSQVLAEPACMLLSNMTKLDLVCLKLLATPTSDINNLGSTRPMDQLVTVFVRGMDKKYNPHADYAFLGSVFANVSMLQQGQDFFLKAAPFDQLAPITKLIVFTEHSSIIRRGGVISTIKNCCFSTSFHMELLRENGINILPYLLLPLAGPEPFDEDDAEGMPDELQLLPDDKKREQDPHLRRILLEAIVLLGTTRPGREYMREKKVYPVLREMHKVDSDDQVQMTCERAVDILMRYESKEGEEEQSGSGAKPPLIEPSSGEQPEQQNAEVDPDDVIEEV